MRRIVAVVSLALALGGGLSGCSLFEKAAKMEQDPEATEACEQETDLQECKLCCGEYEAGGIVMDNACACLDQSG